MPIGCAACAPPPWVVIQTPPPQKSSTPPVNFYALMKWAVTCNANNTIITVLQFLPFVQAIVGFCKTAHAFSNTPADCARYLGSIGWQFADQANFGHIADQKGLADKLSATVKLLDHTTANNSPDIKALFSFADTIIQIENNCCEALRRAKEEHQHFAEQDVEMISASPTIVSKCKANAHPEPKPHVKKPKVMPAFTPHKPGSKNVLALLAQVDWTLEAIQLSNNPATASHKTLQLIADHHTHLEKALSPSKVEHVGSLLHALNISFESGTKIHNDLDVEFQDPSLTKSKDPVDISEAHQM
ncbi:hypothetical protein C0993_012721 [Termitomyces sp. T159_Od127]|nr:hypothetical protein C0993_012721 [Termitomyces sp. T159_Od127]